MNRPSSEPAPPDHLPRPGQRIAQRYELEQLAGAGASAVVYRARDLHSGGRVALKLWCAQRPTHHERSALEAQALASVSHPAVVRYIDHGVSAQGVPYLAMQWIEGETLSERLRGDGLRPSDCLALAERISSGLAALHARGIVHRDLKPSNILLPAGDPRAAVIIDLGVARDQASQLALTADGAYVGTPRYMAPEQIRRPREACGPSDVFALGCILHEALTGSPAYDASEMFAILAQILFEPPPQLRRRRENLPQTLERLITRMLSRNPKKRPTAGEALNAELTALLAAGSGKRLARLGSPSRGPAAASGEATACSGVRSRE
ncbi:MAG TPA: serine/threonine-protein kinase [Polyangiales bacterium]|nr:serine/threonine-protein kinase [Polyangiales bacterium]